MSEGNLYRRAKSKDKHDLIMNNEKYVYIFKQKFTFSLIYMLSQNLS